jgi:hypothetical protein
MISRTLKTCLLTAALAAGALAAEPDRGILVREAVMRVAPDGAAAKLVTAGRGREVVIIEKSRDWVKVLANLGNRRTVTGWIIEKGIIRPSSPNGDQILYGEAVDSEDQASRRRGRKGAAEDAMNLYAAVAEFFPKSPLAGESLYRAADIRWQIEAEDLWTRPSAKEDADVRPKIEDHFMRQVMKKYPETKWAHLAAFHLLQNKVCGDWQGQSKCPERETEVYEEYAKDYPQSPKAPEALYNAAWRQSALIEIYKTEQQPAKSEEAKKKSAALAHRIIAQYPQVGDWAARAKRLLFLNEQNIPTYGNMAE